MEYTLATTEIELQQILHIQQENYLSNVSSDKKVSDGFVTVQHSLELLSKMNQSARQVIAIDKGMVVGYALVMTKEFSSHIPVLGPMFETFKKISYQGKILDNYSFYVMGQICISETYRGQGIFRELYNTHKRYYSDSFDLCVTQVSTSNQRSMKAHESIGFKTIHTFEDETDQWNIIVWDWNK